MNIGEKLSYGNGYESVNVIVLQTMLTGNENYDIMVEVVREDDYLEVDVEDNE